MIAIDILEDWLEYLMTDEDIHNNLDLIEDGEEQVKKSCEEIKYAIKVLKAHNPEVERLRSIADDLYAYIVSDADISLNVIEEQMDWREEE